ncbi:MAG: hypothetical protein ACLRSW_02025 [Christensenellaceae bacterium]
MKNGAIVEKKPCTFNRVLGGIVCIFNAALAIAAAACILLVIFEVTPLKTGALKNVFDSAAVAKTWKYIHTYTLDFVMIGIVAAMGYGGYKTGVLRGFRSVFLTVGYIAAIGSRSGFRSLNLQRKRNGSLSSASFRATSKD